MPFLIPQSRFQLGGLRRELPCFQGSGDPLQGMGQALGFLPFIPIQHAPEFGHRARVLPVEVDEQLPEELSLARDAFERGRDVERRKRVG